MYNRNKLILNNEDNLYNRTSKYLLPQFKLIFNPQEMQIISSLKWITSAVYDEAYPLPFSNNLYSVFDSDTELDYTELRTNEYYVTDYPYIDTELNKHVLVMRLPIDNSVYHFVRGNYSMMYTQEEVDLLFPKKTFINGIEYYSEVYSVLTKRDDYLEIFKNKIREEFNTDHVAEKLDEYDYPPFTENEVLNYQNINLIKLN